MAEKTSKEITKIAKGRPGTLIIPDDEGDVTMDGVNYTSAHGVACESQQDGILEAMGGKVSDRTHKPEYNRAKAKQSVST